MVAKKTATAKAAAKAKKAAVTTKSTGRRNPPRQASAKKTTRSAKTAKPGSPGDPFRRGGGAGATPIPTTPRSQYRARVTPPSATSPAIPRVGYGAQSPTNEQRTLEDERLLREWQRRKIQRA